MTITNAIASLAVRDIESAATWYTRLLGRAPDSAPMPMLLEWQFPHGGWLQVYTGSERAGQGSCTLAVEDLDRDTAHLAPLGVDTTRRSDSPLARTVMITDPDGNHIAFAQALVAGSAR